MFEDIFNNIIDIYPYRHNNSINSANDGYFSKEEVIKDVKCFIRASDEFNKTKLFLVGDIDIKVGDGVYDKQNDNFYTVDNLKVVHTSKSSPHNTHHTTCFISKSFEKADVLNGWRGKNWIKPRRYK